MAGALIFSLAMVAIGLLVFGERMGLPAGIAAVGVAGVLGTVLAASAIFGATSRLRRFVIDEGRGAAVSAAAVAAILLLFGQFYLAAGGQAAFSAFLWLVTGFVASQLFLPANPWSAFRTASEGDGRAGISKGDGLRGAVAIILLAASLGGSALLAAIVPALADRLVEASGWSFPLVYRAVLGLACALALFGGLVSIRQAALVCLAFAVLLLVLPVMPEWLRAQLPQALEGEAIRQIMRDLSSGTILRAGAIFRAPDAGAAAVGFLIGFTSLQTTGAVMGAAARFATVVAAVVLAAAITGTIAFNAERLQLLVTGLAGTAPAQWPVFVYDDVLRGWFSACGTSPDDARQAARACAAVDPRVPLPTGSLRFDNGLAMPALATSTGLPVILGFLWALLPLALTLVACGMALLAAATSWAELLPGRVPALRSTRLARMRLAILTLPILALLGAETGYRLEAGHIRWLLLGACFLGLTAMAAGWLIRIVRAIRNRRQASAAEAGGAQSCAG